MNLTDSTDSLSLASWVVATNDQIAAQFGDEVVVLGFQTGSYYGLGGVGVTIWNHLQQPRTVAEIRDRLCAEYDVAPEQCEQDLLSFLRQLAQKDLIQVLAQPPL